MATWIVGGVIVLITGGILWKLIADRRHGKSTCSGNCQSCHMNCHTK